MRVLIVGANGQLGRELVEAASKHAKIMSFYAADSKLLDVGDREAVDVAVGDFSPDVIFNAAAMTKVDLCEDHLQLAFRVNALGVRNLVQAASKFGAKVVHFSSDYVFDGTSATPYLEWDHPNPISVYGRSKLAGEKELRATDLCIRTSWVVGRYGDNLVKTVLKLASKGEDLRFVIDQVGSLTVAKDLAEKAFEMVLSGLGGLYHVTGQGTGSWFEVASKVLEIAGIKDVSVHPIVSDDLPNDRKARRPKYSVLENFALENSGLSLLPLWHDSLRELVKEIC